MESNFSRSATIEDLKELIKSLNENDVQYVLIGGYALFAHGYQRATTDIDILIPPGKDVGEKLIKALMILPDQSAKELQPEWFVNVDFENSNIRLSDEITVDIMFNACGETYESLISNQETVYIDDLPVKTINIEGLIKTKQTLREKDINDKMILSRALEEMNKNKKPKP